MKCLSVSPDINQIKKLWSIIKWEWKIISKQRKSFGSNKTASNDKLERIKKLRKLLNKRLMKAI